MKHVLVFFAVACAGVFFLSGSASAQAQSDNHLFVTTTFQTASPQGGRMAERDSLLQVYHEQVTMKNPLVLSQRVMRHFWGHNNHDFVIVTEYKDWASIDASDKMDTELFQKYWKDDASRREYNRMYSKYFSGHSDEIYSEQTKLRK